MTTSYRTERRRTPSATPAALLPWVLAMATVLAQIAYPLLDEEPLRLVTIATVVLFFLASVSHAWVAHGARWAGGLVAVTAGGGLLAEAVGVRTGVPFGRYEYTGSLGPELLGVPLLVPMAWTMFAYPAFVVARRLARRFVPLVGGLALASWDLFLDPQMVEAGHWTWTHPEPSLPGIPGIPLTNFAGWLLVAVVMMLALDRLLPRGARVGDGQPAVLFLWTWAGGVIGHAFFFDRPSVALVGGAVMGVVAVPYALLLWRSPWRSLWRDRG